MVVGGAAGAWPAGFVNPTCRWGPGERRAGAKHSGGGDEGAGAGRAGHEQPGGPRSGFQLRGKLRGGGAAGAGLAHLLRRARHAAGGCTAGPVSGVPAEADGLLRHGAAAGPLLLPKQLPEAGEPPEAEDLPEALLCEFRNLIYGVYGAYSNCEKLCRVYGGVSEF